MADQLAQQLLTNEYVIVTPSDDDLARMRRAMDAIVPEVQTMPELADNRTEVGLTTTVVFPRALPSYTLHPWGELATASSFYGKNAMYLRVMSHIVCWPVLSALCTRAAKDATKASYIQAFLDTLVVDPPPAPNESDKRNVWEQGSASGLSPVKDGKFAATDVGVRGILNINKWDMTVEMSKGRTAVVPQGSILLQLDIGAPAYPTRRYRHNEDNAAQYMTYLNLSWAVDATEDGKHENVKSVYGDTDYVRSYIANGAIPEWLLRTEKVPYMYYNEEVTEPYGRNWKQSVFYSTAENEREEKRQRTESMLPIGWGLDAAGAWDEDHYMRGEFDNNRVQHKFPRYKEVAPQYRPAAAVVRAFLTHIADNGFTAVPCFALVPSREDVEPQNEDENEDDNDDNKATRILQIEATAAYKTAQKIAPAAPLILVLYEAVRLLNVVRQRPANDVDPVYLARVVHVAATALVSSVDEDRRRLMATVADQAKAAASDIKASNDQVQLITGALDAVRDRLYEPVARAYVDEACGVRAVDAGNTAANVDDFLARLMATMRVA